MTIQEWHRSFKVQIDSLDTQGTLRLQPEVIDIFLNKAINKIMLDLYDNYEEGQIFSDSISSQTVIANCTFTLVSPGKYKINLPTSPEYYFHLQSNARLKIGNLEGDVKTVRQTLDRESKVLSSPFKGPNDTEIPIFFKDSAIYAYTGGAELVNFNMTYLKMPVQVSYKGNNGLGISSDIDDYLHERIINLAVIMALENYSSERVASKTQIKDVT
jgi:hypothetical protein